MEVKTALKNFNKRLSTSITLKEDQERCVQLLLEEENVLFVQPTGYGKSIVYNLVPILKDMTTDEDGHIALVVSPLRALMADQCQSTKAKGITSVCVTKKDEMTQEDLEGFNVSLSLLE